MTSSAQDLAELLLYSGPTGLQIQTDQIIHRTGVVSPWGINAGDKVLEIGCGQGDCTVVLANLVGPEGKVTAVDPASLDYGRPFTLGQAQAHISSGVLGSRIEWVQADPIEYINSLPISAAPTFDTIVLVHSLWYFSTPSQILTTLRTLRPHAKRICIAEYTLHASEPNAVPHVLAVMTQATMEVRKTNSKSNVRTVVGPRAIKGLAKDVGLEVVSEHTVVPAAGHFDGMWETGMVVGEDFRKEIDAVVMDEREKALTLAMRDATIAAVEKIGGRGKTRSMDVWGAVFS